MRWYKIEIGTGLVFDATGDPNALNVELNIPVSPQNVTSGGMARVWGIDLKMLLNAKSYNNQTIKVYGGMQTGLPLANPAQQGLLVQGTVFPALGNWIGSDMTLDFFITAPTGRSSAKGNANVIHNWSANTPLSQAIKQTLSTAFPKFTPVINISQNLKLPYTDTGFYQTLEQYSRYIFEISKTINSAASYLGVHITLQGDKIIVDDGTVQTGAGVLNYTDLIGQPIWTGVKTVQFKTVMRGDLTVGQTVQMPPTLATLTQSANSAAAPSTSASNLIQGSFKLQKMLHMGNFRQPDATAWCTTFDATQV